MFAGRAHNVTPLADADFIDAAALFAVDGDNRAAVRAARGRIIAVALALAIGFCVLAVRAINVAVFTPVGAAHARASALPIPQRAIITDRYGAVLAGNIETYSAYIWRYKIHNPKKLAHQLAALPGMAAEARLLKRFKRRGGRARIAKKLTPKARDRIFALGLPGVEFDKEVTRYYPRQQFSAHLLGWVDDSGSGKAGVERAFDEQLREEERPVRLALDTAVQFALEDELAKAMTEFSPLAASGIVTNVRTGEVLAMAGLPVFDPNRFGRATPGLRRNRAIQDRYELGSVFKPLTLAMGIEDGLITPDERLDVVSPLFRNGLEIKDMHKSHRSMSVREILVHSSNKGAALIALKVGAQKQKEYLRRFGLLDPARNELLENAHPGESTQAWRQIRVGTIGFGHGLSVTPIGFVTALGALANNGVYIPLTILARDQNDQPQGHKVVSAQTAKILMGLMRDVVTMGTGKAANVAGEKVAGKTGSAEKYKKNAKGYDKDSNIASFVAVFPYDDPHYLVFILLDDPKGDARTSGWETAGWNAAPVAGRVISRIAPILRLRVATQPGRGAKGMKIATVQTTPSGPEGVK